MDATTINLVIALSSLLLVGGGALVGVTVYIIQQIRNTEEKVSLTLQARDSENSKVRHDERNESQKQNSKLEIRIDRLEREAAQKSDLHQMEQRMMNIIAEMKKSLDKHSDKMDEVSNMMARISSKLGAD